MIDFPNTLGIGGYWENRSPTACRWEKDRRPDPDAAYALASEQKPLRETCEHASSMSRL
jgi:hypothetical protein